MTDCPDGLMRDLLPEYAVGVTGVDDAARVSAHLATCEACRAELALLKQARAGLSLGVPRMDVAAIVSALPAPATASRPLRAAPRWTIGRHVWQFATAAGLVLLVGGGLIWQRDRAAPTALVADTAAVATATEEPVAVTPASAESGISFGGGLSDLSLEDLQALLGQMDSLKTLPSTDPESMTPVIAMNEGGTTP
ncbi:MAG: zf-HC2 domain-containing protein [Gemmatimonadetes bacterium]|nr:zf-HC2 domain-containing protein [Gemmatimonadota bacterium]